MAKDVGARKVIFASCAPPIRYAGLFRQTTPHLHEGPFLRYSNVYGIDMPSRNELVAWHREPDQIAEVLGADLVIYQTLPDLIRSVQQFNITLNAFDCSVFTGEYVTGDIDEEYLAWVEENRAEKTMLVNTVSGGGSAPTTNSVNRNHMGSVAVTNAYEGAQSPLSAKLMAEEAMLKREAQVGCSGPMNGADDSVGLHNTYNVGSA
jgi:amidophosphoribosyltransferase